MLRYISFYPSANISFFANISVQVSCISDMHVLEFDKYRQVALHENCTRLPSH